jgi:hypothetical protein
MIKAKITIKQGPVTLFTGELNSHDPKHPGFDDDEDKMEDLFNIERYINTQGAYRCHIEIIGKAGA